MGAPVKLIGAPVKRLVFAAVVLLIGVGVVSWYATRDRPSHAEPREAAKRDEPDPYFNEHGAYKRDLSDPHVAHVSGTVVHEGQSVASARLEATVHPTGMGWTIDEATTNADGTFSIPITSNHLVDRQLVTIEVRAGLMSGFATVTVAPGEDVHDVRIDVGVGVTVTGRIIDNDGEPVTAYGVESVSICLGVRCVRPTKDGSFTLTSVELGRHRLQARAGGTLYSISDLPLTQVAPAITTTQLSGAIDDIVIHVDGVAARAKYFGTGDYKRTAVDNVRARVILARGGTMPASIGCSTWHGREHVPLTGDGILSLPIDHSRRGRVDCEVDGFVRVVIEHPDPNETVDIPLIAWADDAIDLGAELSTQADGLRVVDVADEARDAGLRAGDVVTAIDGISVKRLAVNTARELGFRLPPGHAVSLTVLRRGKELTIHLRSPEG